VRNDITLCSVMMLEDVDEKERRGMKMGTIEDMSRYEMLGVQLA